MDTVAQPTPTPSVSDQLVGGIEFFLNDGRQRGRWLVGVDYEAMYDALAVVALVMHGPKRRISFGTHATGEVCASLGIEGTCAYVASSIRKMHREYVNQPHFGINRFHRRRKPRSMRGK